MKNLRVRLTLWYLALLGTILGGFSLLVYMALAQALYKQADSALENEASKLLSRLEMEDGKFDLDADEVTGGYFYVVTDRTGRVLRTNLPGAPPPPGKGGLDRLGPWRRLSVPAPVGALQVLQSMTSLEGYLDHLRLLLLLALPTTLAIAAGGGWFLADRALSPIERITRAAAALSAEDLSRRLDPPAVHDEVGRLVETFNAMMARLEEAFRRQRQFTSDAAHELRTPLALLRARAELTLERARAPEEYQEAVAEMLGETEHLSDVVAKLLMLARADAGQLKLALEPLDLAEVAHDAAGSMKSLYPDVTLTVRAESCLLVGDQTRLTELIVNLLDNALRHGTVVELSVRPGLLEVKDNGNGIAPEHLPRLFERFFRVDEARSGPHASGLGLAICQAIARQHGGEIRVSSRVGEGTTFWVNLPS